MYDFKESKLWRTAFRPERPLSAAQTAALSKLENAYFALEAKVESLFKSIPQDCHGLTIHDLTHVHQLWSVADQICGDSYPLNALEGFVLGASFLIHDSGLTAAAYPGGLDAIKSCTLFKDILSYKIRSQNKQDHNEILIDESDTLKRQALFETLRAMHAERAADLLATKFKHPLIDFDYSFITDIDLYVDCGSIIGQVAASHHWSLKDVSERFQDPATPPAEFEGWTIDAFKLACILRCADACAIDERRARIMPFILLSPDGVSLDHWDFQSRLKPGFLRGNSLVFESKLPFGRNEMTSWWTAFDSIAIADKELRDCDKEIRSRLQRKNHAELKQLSARNIEGANDPERLKSFVRVSGWIPVDTSVRIGNPISLIEKLGGWALYGNDVIAPIRELVQNSADAIRARSQQDKYNSYAGSINIEISIDETQDKLAPFKITISDNGIGMSSDILTGTLLNFGESLWSSPSLPFTHPGLSNNSRFKPTGQFGIGFYSVFMIADQISITSRPWDESFKSAKTLSFKHGIKSRSELRPFDPELDIYYRNNSTTAIEINVTRLNWLNHIAQQSSSVFEDESDDLETYWKSIELTLSRLTFALGVQCNLKIGNRPLISLNRPDIFTIDNAEFAKNFNEIMIGEGEPKQFISAPEVSLIRTISDADGHIHTRGLIDVAESHGWVHVGGLSVFNRADGLMKGIVGCAPGTAARQGGSRAASKSDLKTWAEVQLDLVFQSQLDIESIFRAVAGISSLDVDITPRALLRSSGEIVSIKEFVGSLKSGSKIFLALERDPISRPYYSISTSFIRHDINFDDLIERKFESMITGSGGLNSTYNKISKSLLSGLRRFSLFSIFLNYLMDGKFNYKIEGPDRFVLGIYSGPDGGRSRLFDRDLKAGDPIASWGLSIVID